MSVHVRPASLQDGVAVLQLLEDVGYYPEPISYAQTYRKTLANPHFLVRVAEAEGKIVGMGQDRGEQVGLQLVPVVEAARAELDAGLEVREHLLGLIERAFHEVSGPPALALAELDGAPHQG